MGACVERLLLLSCYLFDINNTALYKQHCLLIITYVGNELCSPLWFNLFINSIFMLYILLNEILKSYSDLIRGTLI